MMPLVLDDMHHGTPEEPALLTHRDDEPVQARAEETQGKKPEAATGGGGGGGRPPRDSGAATGPNGKGRRRWRRTRRTLYVLIGLGVVIPAIAFFIAYQSVSVPPPEKVVAEQTQPITYYWANGDVMYKNTGENGVHHVVHAKDIPDRVKHAIFAAEDSTFETNVGFDLKGIFTAALHHLQGGGGGGSTITQQYVKKATGNDSYSYVRKALEVVRAFKLTNTQSKSDILTGYLNIVYFGRNAYGIGAAAQAYFGTDVQHLTAAQAAYLAGLIQGPSRGDDEQYVKARWNYVMDEMANHGWITRSQRKSAKLPDPIPYKSQLKKSLHGKMYMKFVVDRVTTELASKGLDMQKLRKSGAKIYLGMDPKAEQAAAAAAHEVMSTDHNTEPKKEYADLSSALVSANPKTGQIIAYYGGNWKRSKLDQAGIIPHNPGSSFKPIDFATAMRQDPSIGIGTTYDGTNHQSFPGLPHPIDNAGGEAGSCGPNCSVMRGMTHSVNTVFYNMVYHMPGGNGPAKVRKMAYDLGIAKHQYNVQCKDGVQSLVNIKDCKSSGVTNSGIAIGSYPVTVRDQAQAYATLANSGNRIPLHFVTKVTDSEGHVLYQFSKQGKQVIDPENPEHGAKIARNVAESMLKVADESHVALDNGRTVASKTGTAQAFGNNADHTQAAWMVGFTPSVVTAVWTGDRQNSGSPIYGAYKNYLGKTKHYDIYGREEPSFIWRKFMNSYLEGKEEEKFSPFEQAALGDSTPPDVSVPGLAPPPSNTGNSSSQQHGNRGDDHESAEPPPPDDGGSATDEPTEPTDSPPTGPTGSNGGDDGNGSGDDNGGDDNGGGILDPGGEPARPPGG